MDAAAVPAGLELFDRSWPDRVAWSAAWEESRGRLAESARAFGADFELDRAGNQWLTLRGRRDDLVVVGGHLDAGPGTDSLAENLGILAGLEVLRRLAADGAPPVTVKLVNWVDGAAVRFGRPFGSSAGAGTMRDWEAAAQLVDSYGSTLNDQVESAGLMFKLVHMARRSLVGTKAYLELGVEPGAGQPLVVASGSAGLERCRVRWFDPEGSDPRGAAERFELEVTAAGGSRITRIAFEDNLVVQLLDQRDARVDVVEGLLDQALQVSDRIATDAGLSVEWQRVWAAAPVVFDARLGELAADVLGAVAGMQQTTLQVGAAEVARGGFPALLLVLRDPEQIALGVDSLERVTRAVIDQFAAG